MDKDKNLENYYIWTKYIFIKRNLSTFEYNLKREAYNVKKLILNRFTTKCIRITENKMAK